MQRNAAQQRRASDVEVGKQKARYFAPEFFEEPLNSKRTSQMSSGAGNGAFSISSGLRDK